MLQNYINYSIFGGSNFKFYFNVHIVWQNPQNFLKTGFSGTKSLLYWPYFDAMISWFETLRKDDDTNNYTWNTIIQLWKSINAGCVRIKN